MPLEPTNIAGPPTHSYHAKDAFGHPLEPGDEVIVPTLSAPRFRLVDVTPVLDPTAQPNSIRVTLSAQITMTVQNGAPIPGILRVRVNAEFGDQAVPDPPEPPSLVKTDG